MAGGPEGLSNSAGASLTGEGGPLRVLPAAPWAVMFRDALAAAGGEEAEREQPAAEQEPEMGAG